MNNIEKLQSKVLKQLKDKLDDARIAIIMNFNATDDALEDTYNIIIDELENVSMLIKEFNKLNGIHPIIDDPIEYELKFVYSQIRKHDRTGILKEMFKDKL